MGNLANTIPFSELYERLLIMARIDSPNNEDYAKGVINDVYTRVIPRMEDWEPLVGDSNLSMTASYNTGTVSVSAGSSSVTGTGTTWTSIMTAADGYKIKFSGNDNVYEFTYASATTATISPALSGATDLSSASYHVYKDEYSLASDFGRFLKNGSLYYYSGGRLSDIISEYRRDDFRIEFVSEPTDPVHRCSLWGMASDGSRLLRVNPPPKTAKVYPYEYIKLVTPMTEYVSGTAAVTNSSTSVTGTGTSWSGNVASGDYFRVDGNGTASSSKWYKISSVGSDTSITLESNYAEATESGMTYTISKSPSVYPPDFHEFILYEGIMLVVGEQSDNTFQAFLVRRNEILEDLRGNYKSRNTNVQFEIDDGGYRDWR